MKPHAVTFAFLASVLPASVGAETIASAGPVIPLIQAARAGDLGQIELLLSDTSDLAATDALGRSALHYAAALGHEKIVSVLAAHLTQLDPVDAEGFTPLMRAAQNGQADIVNELLEHGADPLASNHAGQTALNLARIGAHKTTISLLD